MKNIMFNLDSVIQDLCMCVQHVGICLLQYDTQTRSIAEVHKNIKCFVVFYSTMLPNDQIF